MTDYPGWRENGVKSYELAIAEIRNRGWVCPGAAPGRCRQVECFSRNKCERTGGPIGGGK